MNSNNKLKNIFSLGLLGGALYMASACGGGGGGSSAPEQTPVEQTQATAQDNTSATPAVVMPRISKVTYLSGNTAIKLTDTDLDNLVDVLEYFDDNGNSLARETRTYENGNVKTSSYATALGNKIDVNATYNGQNLTNLELTLNGNLMRSFIIGNTDPNNFDVTAKYYYGGNVLTDKLSATSNSAKQERTELNGKKSSEEVSIVGNVTTDKRISDEGTHQTDFIQSGNPLRFNGTGKTIIPGTLLVTSNGNIISENKTWFENILGDIALKTQDLYEGSDSYTLYDVSGNVHESYNWQNGQVQQRTLNVYDTDGSLKREYRGESDSKTFSTIDHTYTAGGNSVVTTTQFPGDFTFQAKGPGKLSDKETTSYLNGDMILTDELDLNTSDSSKHVHTEYANGNSRQTYFISGNLMSDSFTNNFNQNSRSFQQISEISNWNTTSEQYLKLNETNAPQNDLYYLMNSSKKNFYRALDLGPFVMRFKEYGFDNIRSGLGINTPAGVIDHSSGIESPEECYLNFGKLYDLSRNIRQ